MSFKCLVKGCENRTDQGNFVGELCSPCHRMITTGDVDPFGATFVHKLHFALVDGERTMSFEKLRKTNLDRAMAWHPNGLDEWSVADWALAMVGEAGEVCNAVKKLRRVESGIRQAKGPVTAVEAKTEIGKEVADTFLYLDLLATRLGMRLENLVRHVFNEVSEREGFEHRL